MTSKSISILSIVQVTGEIMSNTQLVSMKFIDHENVNQKLDCSHMGIFKGKERREEKRKKVDGQRRGRGWMRIKNEKGKAQKCTKM